MASSATSLLTPATSSTERIGHTERPTKRRKLDFELKDYGQSPLESTRIGSGEGLVGSDSTQAPDGTTQPALDSLSALPSHPLNIRPLGNLYSSTKPNVKARAGLLAQLPDEVLIHVLEQLASPSLLRVGATCKALYAFARFDELWKTLLVESPLSEVKEGQKLVWCGTWRATYLGLAGEVSSSVDCSGLYSDSLYRPFHCANLPLGPYVDPSLFLNDIPKLSDLTPQEFSAGWADRPFILTEPVKSWRVFHDWDVNRLREQYASQIFRCEAVDWPMETYTQYMQNTNDESPLYLFDSKFVERMGLAVGEPDDPGSEDSESIDYTPPRAFYPDLFNVFGDDRPSHRWLIMGPPRSGSTFHTDPNGTSAWNAVIRGRKYWIMCPRPPPGVYVSEDESEVTSPSSIAEWLLGFHAEARQMPDCYEGICEEGEVLHVPGGWYHLVLNLPSASGTANDNIAITQNFVPEPRLKKVLRFLKDKPDQVSGFSFSDDNQEQNTRTSNEGKQNFSVYEMFVQRLEQRRPELLKRVIADDEQDEGLEASAGKWEDVVKDKETGAGAFSFGFDVDDDSDEAQ